MASPIDPTLAKSLIQEFQTQNSSASGPGLTTPDGSFINGYFIDRQSLETMLSDPNVAGVHVEYAKHPDFIGQPVNVFTIILVGAVPNTDIDATTVYKSSGDYFDQLPPCPPICCNLL
ncbi:MAG: hypothetical protein JO080_08110 [Mucilaginibacter sp.]|nr:hypothetical protein [Mucilaginibacter sp.]